MDFESAQNILNAVYTRKPYRFEKKRDAGFTDKVIDASLIIPVYNGEKYLRECIKSLLAQITEYTFEVICIDDGSQDHSGEILDDYAAENDCIKVIHQENGGISAARNTGLAYASGRFVGFLDDDDYVRSDYVQILLDTAYKYRADFVKCGYKIFHSSIGRSITVSRPFAVIEEDKNKLMQYDGYIWGGLQKRVLWDDFGFPEGYWYEDMLTRLILFRRSKTFINSPELIYFKREHRDSASRTVWKEKNFQCLDQLYLVEELLCISRQMHFETDEFAYRILLNELGLFLYGRIQGLDKKIRMAAFAAASKIIKDNKPAENLICSAYEADIERCFLSRDFTLWEMTCRKYS